MAYKSWVQSVGYVLVDELIQIGSRYLVKRGDNGEFLRVFMSMAIFDDADVVELGVRLLRRYSVIELLGVFMDIDIGLERSG